MFLLWILLFCASLSNLKCLGVKASLSKDGCEFVNSRSEDYALVSSKCPLSFFPRFYYFQDYTGYSEDATYYYKEHHLPMLCDATCDGKLPLNDTAARNQGTPFKPHESTVIRDIPSARKLFQQLLANAPKLPWCKTGEDSVGYWVPREFLPFVSTKRLTAKRLEAVEESEVFERMRAELSKVMSGDIAVALSWKYVWIPTNCRLFRYNVTSFLRCAEKFKQRTNSSLWIYFLGDSITRGTYCELLRVLSTGGECGGGVKPQPCFHNTPLGSKVNFNYPSHTEWNYLCRERDFQVSFHGFPDAGYPFLPAIVNGFMLQPRGGSGDSRGPSVLIYNSGTREHKYHFRKEEVTDQISKAGKGKKAKVKKRFNYISVMETRSNPVNHVGVNVMRPIYVRRTLNLLHNNGFSGKFIYRSNLCNTLFEARASDAKVEQMVREWGGEVFEYVQRLRVPP